MGNCILCQIVKGERHSYTLYQDETVTAFLDINPVTAGHSLVVPNKHFARLDKIEAISIMQGLMNGVIKVANLLIHSDICNDYTVLQDNGVNAQQDIMHAHFHIIPRHHDESIEFHLPTDEQCSNKDNLTHTYHLLKANDNNVQKDHP